MNHPLVSIVTPAYRAAAFVGDAIASVLGQDYRDWEMLVVDDCSPDDTCGIVEKYSLGDSRVRLLRQDKNGGPAAARQRAIDEARGRYIAFLDSDDWWLPGKLSKQLRFMDANAAALSFTQFRRVSQDRSTEGVLAKVPEQLTYSQLLCNTAIATSTVVVDREITGPFAMKRTYYDDYALWLELLRRGHVARGLREDLMRYRVVGGSVSRNKGKSALWVWRTYRGVEKLGLMQSAWCFGNYAFRGWLKYRRF